MAFVTMIHTSGRTPEAGQANRAAVELASGIEGLRLALATALDDRYRVRVVDDGSMVGLRRR